MRLADFIELPHDHSYGIEIDEVVVGLSPDHLWGSILSNLKLAFLKGLLGIRSGPPWALVEICCMGVWPIAGQAGVVVGESELSILINEEMAGYYGAMDQIVFLMQKMHSPHKFLQEVKTFHFAYTSQSAKSGVLQQIFKRSAWED